MDTIKNWFRLNYIILLILIFAAALRFYNIDYQSVWLDEICTINEANPAVKWSDLSATIVVSDPHPQLYFALLKIMFLLFGYTTMVARVFSAIVGVCGVFSIYVLGKELANRKVGLISAFLLSVNYFHIYYSQEVRMYGLLFLFTTLSYYGLVVFLKRTTFKNAVLYGVLTGLMLLTQFFGLFVLASQLVILLIYFLKTTKENKLQFVYKSLTSGVIMILFFIPAINIFIETTKKKYVVIQPTTVDTIKQIFKDFVQESSVLIWFSIALIAVYFFFFIKNKSSKDKGQSLVVIVLLCWILVTLLIPIIRSYLVTPMIISRYFITILPPVILLVALGINKINNKAIMLSVVALFGLITLYTLIFSNEYYTKIAKTQFREVSEYVVKENPQKDPVVSKLSWYLIYLLNKDGNNIPIVQNDFENYVQQIMKDPGGMESFWYFGAFGDPLTLSEPSSRFLAENFVVAHSLDKFDSWTKHYVLRSAQNAGNLTPENSIVLSNITDAYWTGGVSTNNTILLVDFSKENEAKLKSAVRLVANNGKKYKIMNIEQAGNFIHVHIDKSPYSNKDLLKYPNPIGFIK